MSEKTIKPMTKTALEMGPILAFFAGYVLLKDKSFEIAGQSYAGFIVMTALFIPILAASTFALWRLTGKLSVMQVLTLVLVVVFGGLTVWLNDERFFKMKPTLIYIIFAAMLGFGLMRGQSYLALVMGEALPLDQMGWLKLTRRMALFFLGLAVANEVIWRNFSTDLWVQFKTFGLPITMFGCFMAQSGLMGRHAIEADKDDAAD